MSGSCVQVPAIEREVTMAPQDSLATQQRSSETPNTTTTTTTEKDTDSLSCTYSSSPFSKLKNSDTADDLAGTPAIHSQMVARNRRVVVTMHTDIISDPFWDEHPMILGK